MNNVAEHQNVHGQKIGLKYYLETRIKPKKADTTDANPLDKYYGEECYPLYIRITAKQQTTKIKSSIDIYLAPRIFEEFLNEESNIKQIEAEKKAITRAIRGAISSSDRSFSLSNALKSFSAKDYDIRYIVGECLGLEFNIAMVRDIIKVFKCEYENTPTREWSANPLQHGLFKGDGTTEFGIPEVGITSIFTFSSAVALNNYLNAYFMIRSFATPSYPSVNNLVVKYGLPLLRLPEYLSIMSKFSGYNNNIDFFVSEEFDNLFIEYCDGIEQLQSLRTGFALLVENHEKLLTVVNKLK